MIVFPLYINQEQVKQEHKIYSKVHVNESVVVLHVHTYELLANCCISIKMGHIFSFTGTNKIILLCEDLNFCCCCCFVFIFAETLIN